MNKLTFSLTETLEALVDERVKARQQPWRLLASAALKYLTLQGASPQSVVQSAACSKACAAR
jgi:hypothetical protein